MTGIIRKPVGTNHDHIGLSWECNRNRIVRLGFVWRQTSDCDWKPVIQAEGQLLPLDACAGLTYAINKIVSYHAQAGTIEIEAHHSHWNRRR